MSAMRADELGNLEKQARIIQQNVRAWALRRNYINMRNAVITLQMFWRNRRSGRAQRGGLHQARLQLERDEVLPQGERNTVYINDTHDQSLDFEDMGGGDQSTTSFHRSNLSQVMQPINHSWILNGHRAIIINFLLLILMTNMPPPFSSMSLHPPSFRQLQGQFI